jgi:lysozyme
LSSTSTITQAQADAFLQSDVQKANNTVNSSVTAPLSTDQAAAMTSLCYNLGGAGFANRTIVKDINDGNTAQGAADFNLYIYSNKAVNSALVARRMSEQTLFSTGVILGNQNAFKVKAPTNAPGITNLLAAQAQVTPQIHYQIRAQQLRKTAGVLEQYHQTVNSDPVTATFAKAAWAPSPAGHFQYVYRDDHLPMVAMGKIKEYLKDRLQRQDEAVFHINHVRNIIEKVEDSAQQQAEADAEITSLIAEIDNYFTLPNYSAVLVKDQTDVYPPGSTTPRYRVSQLDAPTPWELQQHGRVADGKTPDLKETPQPVSG